MCRGSQVLRVRRRARLRDGRLSVQSRGAAGWGDSFRSPVSTTPAQRAVRDRCASAEIASECGAGASGCRVLHDSQQWSEHARVQVRPRQLRIAAEQKHLLCPVLCERDAPALDIGLSAGHHAPIPHGNEQKRHPQDADSGLSTPSRMSSGRMRRIAARHARSGGGGPNLGIFAVESCTKSGLPSRNLTSTAPARRPPRRVTMVRSSRNGMRPSAARRYPVPIVG